MLGGQAAFLSGHQKEALRWLKSAAKNFPDNPDAPYNLGVLYQSLGDTHKALDAFRAAVKAGTEFRAGALQSGHGACMNWGGAKRRWSTSTGQSRSIRATPKRTPARLTCCA